MRTPRLWPGRLVAALRERCPPPYPVELKIVKRIRIGEGGSVGRCIYKRKERRFVIYVEAGHEWVATREAVVHEFSHCLSWRHRDHGPAWSLAYGRAYRASLGWWTIS